MPELSAGDTAWVLTSAALVLLMTPGLALFYGGMVRAKGVLNMLMMNFAAIAVVSVLWVLYGFSLALSTDVGGGLLGGLSNVGLRGLLGDDSLSGTIPSTVFVAFQAMFAIITVALISGAIADRAKFSAWLVFVALWSTLVYFPVAHWVFFFDDGNGGWIGDRLGAIDFAGGTAVHINAGAAALALALILGQRVGWRKEPMRPHNLPLVLLGASLLWFGWFGFNAGSAVAADGAAGVAFINTQAATAAAVLGWLLVEKIRDGKPTTLGAASGAVAGLVAITPSCSSVTPIGALVIGVAAGVLCALAVSLKTKLGYDDSLDVVGVHLVGGMVGSLLIGLFASAAAPAGVDGLLYGGGLSQLGRQTVAVVAVLAYSFVVSWLIGKAIDATIGFRVSTEDEVNGIDLAEHAETAYDFSTIGGGTWRIAGERSGQEVPVDSYNSSGPARPAEKTEGSVTR
ncbi:ammonium transporter [Thermasporomyces composti]|jgi:Amt family ammonium transporter|uniref:Ammonium transporter n=1 Tax=Thermasporomyces composti TaxID=696763 RepID=A0A3D9VAN1_THECX|nr:ammonium transporter [Thermasporomyces composti]REF35204.1 ammonium transporter [Thermasporomyces composti]